MTHTTSAVDFIIENYTRIVDAWELEEDPLLHLSRILDEIRLEYQRRELQRGKKERAIRQSWVSAIGRALEEIFAERIRNVASSYGYGVTTDTNLKSRNLPSELARVRKHLAIPFGDTFLLPDGDIIVYRPSDGEVVALYSIKNSFRERFTETPYWKMKFLQFPHTRNIQVYMVTPDHDFELKPKRKATIVLGYELDGIYIARADGMFSAKIRPITRLQPDLESLLRERSSW